MNSLVFTSNCKLVSEQPSTASISAIVNGYHQLVTPLAAKREASMLPFDSSADCYLFIMGILARPVVDTLFFISKPFKRCYIQMPTKGKFLRLLHPDEVALGSTLTPLNKQLKLIQNTLTYENTRISPF